jgi:ribonucleoside-diphosphate reductase alpha chain
MKIQRLFTRPGVDPLQDVTFKKRKVTVYGQERSLLVNAPVVWSDSAVEIAVRKYLRKSLRPVSNQGERDIRELLHRMALSWKRWGKKMGIFSSSHDAENFYSEVLYMLATQKMAPNSPQWFNTGLYEQYGLKGKLTGHYALNLKTNKIELTKGSYTRPQAHACFIQSVEDSLVGEKGMLDLLKNEARLFKFGSGSGTNFSPIREKDGPLESGGQSSGVLSFLKVSDRSAASIKSGGTTRRAAKMVILDHDHPDILEFIRWKQVEEDMASAMVCGGVHLVALEQLSEKLVRGELTREEFRKSAADHYLPEGLIEMCLSLADQKKTYRAPRIRSHYEGEAYQTISGQNANHSIRLPDRFFKALKTDRDISLISRSPLGKNKKIKASLLWNELLQASWRCADPGLMFQDTINRWHTCLADGEIVASNPCGEYLFLNDTACNLASINIVPFFCADTLEFKRAEFIHAVRLTTMMLDITVTMAGYPSETIAKRSLDYRTLGLGITNLAQLLMLKTLPYDSDEGREQAHALVSLMSAVAWKVSAELAQYLGSYPRFKNNRTQHLKVMKAHLKSSPKRRDELSSTDEWKQAYMAIEKYGARNAQTTLIAPTGTISLVMDCETTGIEPEFSFFKTKNLSGGGVIEFRARSLKDLFARWGYPQSAQDELWLELSRAGSFQKSAILSPHHKKVLAQAREISPEGHLKMVAALQPFLSGGVSKTLNLPSSTTYKELSDLYLMAHAHGLKSIAIYRDGSKLSEPLTSNSPSTVQHCGLCRSSSVYRVGGCFLCLNCAQTTACS